MDQNWKKQFAVIYAGQAFSFVGSAAVQFAVIWWLTIQTESAVMLSLASIVSMLPFLLLGPFAGVWVDRFNRRTVMMAADGIVALSSIILGAAFLVTPAPPVWFIFTFLFFRGVGSTFHGPAIQAAIPMLVPADMLTKAGGWGNLISSLANMLGPVLGAGLMAAMPIWAIMLVDIAGALIAVVCLLFVVIPDVPREGDELKVLADLKLGLAAIRNNRALMAVLMPLMVMNLIFMPLGSLFPLLVRTHFQGEAWHNSLVEFSFAGGLLLSSFVIGIWGGMKKRFLMVSFAIGLLGATSLISGVLAPSWFMVFVFVCFIMGVSITFINVPLIAFVQETTAPEMMGKVLSLIMMLMTISMPLGLLIAGPASEVIGIDGWFLWSGAALIASGLLFFLRTRAFDSAVPKPGEKS